MDNTELKAALLNKTPVIMTHADGHESEYKCVTAIVYREKNKQIDVTAEVLDVNGKSVVICAADKIRGSEL